MQDYMRSDYIRLRLISRTHSTVLLQGGGLLIVMKTQLARIVIMMNKLNNMI
jgi:hypothetical protein